MSLRLINNSNARRVVLVLILTMVAIEIVRSSVGTFFVVEGNSMCPTFGPDDVVQAKTSYATPERGDVVVITDDRGDRAIKRIIGLPGETVTLYGGFVYIDRQRMNEPYLPTHTYTFKSDETNELPEQWQLGDNQYFVLGDNRFESRDSRDFGPVNCNRIHRVVSLPENAARPGFCGIMLLGSGKGVSVKYSPGRNRAQTKYQTSSARI